MLPQPSFENSDVRCSSLADGEKIRQQCNACSDKGSGGKAYFVEQC